MTNKHILALIASTLTVACLQAGYDNQGQMLDTANYHRQIHDAVDQTLTGPMYTLGTAVSLNANAQKMHDDAKLRLLHAKREAHQAYKDHDGVGLGLSKEHLQTVIETTQNELVAAQRNLEVVEKTLRLAPTRPISK